MALGCKSEPPAEERHQSASESIPASLPASSLVSPLASPPDWSLLDPFQETMTRDEFVRLLGEVYTSDDAYKSFVTIHTTHATIRASGRTSSVAGRTYELRFAPSDKDVSAVARPECRRDHGLPLDGLTIAIDPGHIGGQWAKTEWRWFRIGDSAPVAEGDLNLRVARLLARELVARGAAVTLVRDQPRPVTRATPAELEPVARRLLIERGDLHGGLSRAQEANLIRQESTLLAYRSSEIRARAEIVNQGIKPDLTICVHFDAASFPNPAKPSLTGANHLHAIVHGAYTAAELAYEDMRFHLLDKLLRRTHRVEMALARSVVQAMVEATGLGPEKYPATDGARRMSDDGYIWARNLAANRLYSGPVLYLEPYVMNNRDVFARIQAGDYPGLRLVAGKLRPSIFREYAESVARGLADYYSPLR